MTKLMLTTIAAIALITPAVAGHRVVPPYAGVCSIVRTPGDTLNVRSGPGVEYSVLDELSDGDIVVEAEYSGDWVRIEYTMDHGDVGGWVNGRLTRRVRCPRA
jgi:N-acetylmuramoyl-L-alanine amidase